MKKLRKIKLNYHCLYLRLKFVNFVNKNPGSDPLESMESYVNKMGDYMLYMQELEERNARLEFENSRYRAENESLKGQLSSSNPSQSLPNRIDQEFNQSVNPSSVNQSIFPIQEKIRNLHMQKH